MKKPNTPKKLPLNTERVRELTDAQLTKVDGGYVHGSTNPNCTQSF